MQQLYSKVIKNFTLVAVEDGEQIGQDTGNNTYSGLLGLLYKGEAHISFIPFGMTVSPEIIDYSSAINSIDGVFAQQVKVSTRKSDVFKSFAVYSATIQSLLLMSTLLLAFAFKILSYNQGRGTGFFYKVLRVLVYQADIQQLAKLSCLLTTITLKSLYAVCKMFEGSIKTDVVTKDTSQIVNALDDFLRLQNLRPIFYKDDGLTNFLRFNPTAKYREVWNRAVRMGIEKSELLFTPASLPPNPTNMVFVGNRYIARGLTDIYCKRDPNCKYWIGPTRYTEITNALYISKTMPKQHKNTLDFKLKKIGEAGMIDFIWKRGSTQGVSAVGGSPICTKNKVDDLFENVHVPEVVPQSYYSRFFWTFILAAVFCFFVLAAELLTN